MKAVIQRVKHASVTIDGNLYSKIGHGLLVLYCVEKGDTNQELEWMCRKIPALRIFEDENGKTNLSLADVNGELLLVSQFTLYADCRKGNRPSFTDAGKPDMAKELYHYIIESCKNQIAVVEHGVFGADMKISLVNDGPFTIILDSDELIR